MTERAEKLMRYSKKDLAERCDILERNIKSLKEGIEILYSSRESTKTALRYSMQSPWFVKL